MVSQLAKGDYEDMLADGLAPTLEDFDRLNQIALRLTDGAETTAANFPRIGWAGDVPFYQPTCAAISWYLTYVERADFDVAMKDACWFFALAHARDAGAFLAITADDIKRRVNDWICALPVTRDEIIRACRYAARGFDDAVAAKNDAEAKGDKTNTDDEQRERSLGNLEETVTVAAAVTGIPPSELMRETPSRLCAMIDAVRDFTPMGGGAAAKNTSRLQADYDLTYREIRKRLVEEKAAKEAVENGKQ